MLSKHTRNFSFGKARLSPEALLSRINLHGKVFYTELANYGGLFSVEERGKEKSKPR